MPRPKLEIDGDEVQKLANMGIPITEIAAWFGCDEGTIRKRFGDVVAQGKLKRKTRLRIKLFGEAMKGNIAAIIFLAKNDLGMSDKQSVEHTGPDGGPIKTEQSVKFDHDRFAELYKIRTRGNRVGPAAAAADGK